MQISLRAGYESIDNIDPSITGVLAYAFKANGDVSYISVIPRVLYFSEWRQRKNMETVEGQLAKKLLVSYMVRAVLTMI